MSPDPAHRQPKLGVVGATGAVGSQVADLLGTRAFDPSSIRLFASGAGASQTVTVGSEEALVEEFGAPADLSDLDAVILCGPPSVNAEVIRQRPCPIVISIDCFARDSAGLALVAPGLTSRERLAELKSAGGFAVPHPAAYAIALVLGAIEFQPDFIAATLMLGASSGGRHDVEQLVRQSTDLLNARLEEDEDEPQRAFNIFAIGDDDTLADTIASQAAALIKRPLKLALAVVHVPAFHGCALSLHTTAAGNNDTAQWAGRLRSSPGLLLADDEKGISITDAVGQEAIFVRPRVTPTGATLLCLFDNARLAALCAVWIAETIVAGAELN